MSEEQTEKKPLETTEHIVAYLDLYNDNSCPNDYKTLNTIKNIYDSTCEYYKGNIESSEKYDLKITIFSDIVIISYLIVEDLSLVGCDYDITKEEKITILFNSLLEQIVIFCGIFKWKCEALNVPVCGAITSGEYFADDIMVWGKALVRAYELGKNNGHHKDIIIDKNISNKLSKHSINYDFLTFSNDIISINHKNIMSAFGINQSYSNTIKKHYPLSLHIVACIDILGAKELINIPASLDSVHEQFEAALKACNVFNSLDSKMEAQIFSDNIIISYPIDDCINDKLSIAMRFSEVVNLSAMIQHNFFQNITLLRGGITIGEFYRESNETNRVNILFGEALARANNLEKEASNPKIIIDSNILKILEIDKAYLSKKPATFENEASCINKLFHRNHFLYTDNNYFVNYLSDDFKKQDLQNLKKLHKVYNAKLNLYKDDEKLQPKYKWHRDYMLSIISQKLESQDRESNENNEK